MPASRSRLRASFLRSFFSFLSRTLCSSGDTDADAGPWKRRNLREGVGRGQHRNWDPRPVPGPSARDLGVCVGGGAARTAPQA